MGFMPKSDIDYYLEDERPVEYQRYLFLLHKNFLLVLIVVALACGLGALYASKIPDSYQAYSQIVLERIPSSGSPQTLNPAETKSEIEAIFKENILKQAGESLKLTTYLGIEPNQTAQKIRSMLQVEQVGNSNLFNIRATSTDPLLAANLANAIARTYVRKNFEMILSYSPQILNWMPKENEDSFMTSLPAFQTDAQLKEWREKQSQLEAELTSLRRSYRSKHPRMIKAEANLKYAKEKIEEQTSRIIEQLKEETKKYPHLRSARLIEEAKTPSKPLPSQSLWIIAAAGAGSFIFCLFIITLGDRLDHTIRSVEDMERMGVALPFLGHIPLIKKKQIESGTHARIPHEISELSDAFRYLRVAINFSGRVDASKVLVFSSCLPHEGKSFAAYHIARSSALDGNKTLLVDCDFRRPVQHQIFKMDPKPGLSNYLASTAGLDDIIKKTNMENLYVALTGAGPVPLKAPAVEKLKIFLEEARQRFDRVILDCSDLGTMNDVLAIGELTKYLILVIAAGQTPATLIKQSQKTLEKSNIKILGIILNKVNRPSLVHSALLAKNH